MNIPTVGHKLYVAGRGLAMTLALIFAFYYSKELGVLSRSYLVMIMTSSILISTSLTSGTTLTLRNFGKQKTTNENLRSFHSLILFEILIGILLFFFSLLAFSVFKYPLHPTLFSISLLYFVVSAAHLISFEILVSCAAFKALAISEIVTIVLQILSYFLIGTMLEISIAIRVLVSFIFSYIVILVAAFIYLRHNYGYKVNFGNPMVYLGLSKGNHTLGIVLGIVDRIDRVIIAWSLPLILLGKYAIMSSSISFFRFVPETIGKLIVSSKSNILRKYLQLKFIWLWAFVLISVVVICLQAFTSQFFGPEWLLSWSIAFVFALQEIARGTFQLTTNYKVALGDSLNVHRAAKYLLFISCPLAIVLSRWLGIIGVPLGFLVSYVFVLLFVMRVRGHRV